VEASFVLVLTAFFQIYMNRYNTELQFAKGGYLELLRLENEGETDSEAYA